MIVLDASAVVEMLMNTPLAVPVKRELEGRQDTWLVPHLLDVEVVSALRNLLAGRRVDAHRAEQLLADLEALPAERIPHTPLLERMWDLRHNYTAYDAAYIALAEAMDADLLTCDEKLLGHHHARVILVR